MTGFSDFLFRFLVRKSRQMRQGTISCQRSSNMYNREEYAVKHSRGEIISKIVMIILPLSALGFLFYSLETYHKTVHSDAGFTVGLHALGCMAVNIILWLKMRKKGKAFSIIAAFSLVALAFVLYTAEKIPFCVECDQVTADDLGFLIHWITPIGG